MKKLKDVSKQLYALLVSLPIFLFSLGPVLTTESTSVSLYQAVVRYYPGKVYVCKGLLTSYILLSVAIAITITLYVLDLKKIEFGTGKGILSIVSSLLFFTCGFLFSYGRQILVDMKSKYPIDITNFSSNAIGWATILVAILCFLACVVLFYDGAKRIHDNSQE
jgi:magnesium-transporting ATPase (P-type)